MDKLEELANNTVDEKLKQDLNNTKEQLRAANLNVMNNGILPCVLPYNWGHFCVPTCQIYKAKWSKIRKFLRQ
ncbi:hypothetical protein AAUPMC_18894 [Pasteurella multocida subsp. multocida str. Anand1_cattle]|nr:hypothetical protein AAUPMC_18894 [Pasteurella multocida subsp. multocida str. Anand1_cattle]